MKGEEMDDQQRGHEGVVCSLQTLENGKLRVVMDDVINVGGSGKGPWEHRVLVTWKDYDATELKNLESLPESELAGLGHYLLARLMAVRDAGT